jgi:ABC-type multidrug transport system fused ATPase/permease subunit
MHFCRNNRALPADSSLSPPLTLEDICFSYDNDGENPLLQGMSMTFMPGKVT